MEALSLKKLYAAREMGFRGASAPRNHISLAITSDTGAQGGRTARRKAKVYTIGVSNRAVY